MYSVSSLSTSHLSSQCHLLPPSSALPRWARRSPGHRLLRQVSDSRIPGFKSPSFSISEEGSTFGLPGWSNESIRSSHGGSSDGGSTPVFLDFMTTSHRESWSFDSENRDRISRLSGRISSSPSIDIQSCGVCLKLLSQKSSLGSQKIISTNELAVVAVLICGHAYHAECLENMTPEISKYDPACPICTFGEKQTAKLSEKALRAEMDMKVKNSKQSRKRVMDGVLDSDSLGFARQKSSGHESRGLKMCSSSSMKSSSGKPFLRRHFSFGSKGSRSMSDYHSTRKKGFFWTRSSKEWARFASFKEVHISLILCNLIYVSIFLD